MLFGFNILENISDPVNKSIGLKNGTHFEIEDISKAKTGDEIKIVDDKTGNVLKTYTVVVFGDINGDGIYDGRDATILSFIINGMLTPSPAMRLAADCNHDSVINTDDLAIIEQAGLLLSNVSQGGDLFESWIKRSLGVKDSSNFSVDGTFGSNKSKSGNSVASISASSI